MAENTRAWEVEGTVEVDTRESSINQPLTTYKYRHNVNFMVIASTLEEACEKVRVKRPDVVLVKVFRSRNVDGLIA